MPSYLPANAGTTACYAFMLRRHDFFADKNEPRTDASFVHSWQSKQGVSSKIATGAILAQPLLVALEIGHVLGNDGPEAVGVIGFY